jgi:hypothetical protein
MTDKQHFELLVATIAAGILASWDRGGSGRLFDFEKIVEDARECAAVIQAPEDQADRMNAPHNDMKRSIR